MTRRQLTARRAQTLMGTTQPGSALPQNCAVIWNPAVTRSVEEARPGTAQAHPDD